MKKLISLLLSLLLLGTSCFAAAAGGRSAPWYGEALGHAVENGLLKGDEGGLSPEKDLTRAQLAAVLGRAFSAQKRADLSGFTDVPENAWYYEDMAKAVQMGIFQGDGNRLLPDSPAAREEVFTVLTRCFQLPAQGEDALTRFADGGKVSFWAQEAAEAMVSCGYIQGSGNRIEPQKSITRAEFAQVIDRMVQNYYSAGGIYSEFSKGNVVINRPGISLRGAVIEGDLILADGVGENDVDLSGVTITGRILVRGGNLTVREGTAVPLVQVANPNGTTRIQSDSSAEVKSVTAETPTTLSGKSGKVEARGPLTIEPGASVETLVLSGSAAQAEIHGAVDHLVTSADAEGIEITVPAGGSVAEAVVEAPGVTIAGEGSLGKVTANGDGLHVETPNTQLVVGEAVSGVTAGSEKVEPGSSVTTNSTGTGVQDTPPAPSGPSRVSVTGIEVEPGTLLLQARKTAGLTARILPGNASEQGVDWSSSDGTVAVVDAQGQVMGVSAGTVVITAASREGNFTAACTVTVEGAKTWYVDGAGGSDENDGLTDGKALKTIERAVEKAEDGDTIVICGPVSLGEEGIVTTIDKGLTFTGKTAEKDYGDAAQLVLTGDISLGGETVFRNIQLRIGRTMDLFANGYPLLFDQGVDTQYLTYVDNNGNVLPYMLYVYGGGLNRQCESTSVTMNSGRIYYLFGGGKATIKGETAKVNGDTSITITGGYVDDSIVGGGETYAEDTDVSVGGNTTIDISGNSYAAGWYDSGGTLNCGEIFGGGWATNRSAKAKVLGETNIMLRDTAQDLFCEIFGGGHTGAEDADATVGNVSISLENAGLGDQYIYGGGMVFNSGSPIVVSENVSISVTDGKIGAVIGSGAAASGRVCRTEGNVSISLTNCTVTEAIVGGGFFVDNGNGAAKVSGDVTITLDGVSVPEILCAGLDQSARQTGDVSINSGELVIKGLVDTNWIEAGDCTNGCTVALGSNASLQLEKPDDLSDLSEWPWYDSEGIAVIDNVDTLRDTSFVWTVDRWVQK